MEPILYWYPFEYFHENDYENKVVVRRKSIIIPFQLNKEPYEISVKVGESCFHMIFGNLMNGMFLCIPDLNIVCELCSLSNRKQNMDILLNTDRIDYEDTTAITWALYNIGNLLRFYH